ncbi:carboxymuconolactone decarboxylase family protein [Catenulispora yoronensis]|uniref:Carboxymuconolactone decarboxylase family protein n=1 Tax=Catenulispora yoronensis TaxID=450799 RepID=A0ABP5GRU0_9ACTN
MPHIDLGNDQPGIRSLFFYRPETAAPLSELAEILLRGPSTLERWERELIATHVSGLNECRFCTTTHAAFTAAQLPEGLELDVIRADVGSAPISDKLKALLDVAAAVQRGGRQVTTELVDAARAAGADDPEIHDTVLIAAAFCMFNRYVDGLATVMPDDLSGLAERAKALVAEGYLPTVAAARAHQAQAAVR